MKSGNIFESIPDRVGEEIFDLIVQKKEFKIERIISKGHTSPDTGWYDQDHDEWVIVLKGGATINVEDGEAIQLEAGSYLNIPAHTKHKVSWTKADEETIWIAVHY